MEIIITLKELDNGLVLTDNYLKSKGKFYKTWPDARKAAAKILEDFQKDEIDSQK